MKNINEIHSYWKNPCLKNEAKKYFSGVEKSKFLFDEIEKNLSIDKNDKILEIGCNVGRNLKFLYDKGFKKITGIEISEKAIYEMIKNYYDMCNDNFIYNVHLVNDSIENVITTFDDNSFDLIFTMAVLVHVHYDSDWIFKHIARIAKKYVLIIEHETYKQWRHFPRNYKNIFEELKMKQIYEKDCSEIKGLKKYILRVFEK